MRAIFHHHLAEVDRETAYDKAEEARQEAEEAAREERRAVAAQTSTASSAPTGSMPIASLWAHEFDEQSDIVHSHHSPLEGQGIPDEQLEMPMSKRHQHMRVL